MALRFPPGVLPFLAISYGLSWTVWEVLASRGWRPGDHDAILYFLFASFGPAVAALVMRLSVTGEGFADAGLRLGLRRGWPYYLLAWLMPLPIAALVLVLAQGMGLAEPDWSLATGLADLANRQPEAADMAGRTGASVLGSMLVASLFGAFVLFGEEFGWRGWLQRRISPGRPVAAAVMTGVLWSFWHLPLNLRGYNFPGEPVQGQIAFTLSLVCLSVILAWLQNGARSLWAACLGHSAVNTMGATLVALAVGGQGGVSVSYLGWLGLIPLGGVAWWIVRTGRLEEFGEAGEPEEVGT